MKTPLSLTKATIKNLRALHTAKGRILHGAFVAEGSRVCETLIASQCKRAHLYVTDNHTAWAKKLVPAEKITVISPETMDIISPSTTPSGILGVFAIPPSKLPAQLNAGLVLCQINDPGNMGTLIRSAVAFGFPEIIVVEGVDSWNPKVIQASAGTIGLARVYECTWPELAAHKNRPPLAALVPRGGTLPDTHHRDVLLVVGNEAHGLPEPWAAQCPVKITLPMPGKAESLNAAIAGSIALYLLAMTQPSK